MADMRTSLYMAVSAALMLLVLLAIFMPNSRSVEDENDELRVQLQEQATNLQAYKARCNDYENQLHQWRSLAGLEE